MNRYQTKEWKELISIQNNPKYEMIDIITITGFMNNEEFLKHVQRYREMLNK